ncbi:MAG: SfnB family sulfur acquisition oxidoreductase, partial [Mesorhizobium sp.]
MTIQSRQASDSRSAVPPVERPSAKAHVIKADAEAIAVAEKLAAEFAR